MWMWMWAAFASEPERVCPERPRDEVVRAARDVEQRWLHLDEAGMQLARSRLAPLIGCLDVPLEVRDAVAVHRARGILAWVDGDTDAALRAFRAVHRLQPGWTLPEDLLPREHPLWRIYEAAAEDEGDDRGVALRIPPPHGWVLDGVVLPEPEAPRAEDGRLLRDYELPADRAFLLQLREDGGGIRYSGYHFSTVDIPVGELVLGPTPEEIRRRRSKAAHIIGTVVSGAMLGASAATLGLGLDQRARLTSGDVEISEVTSIQSRANTLGATAAGLGAAGATLMTVTWAVRW